MQIVKKGIPQEEKLLAFGFQKNSNGYGLKKSLLNGDFYADILLLDNTFTVTVYDSEFCDRYALFDVEGAEGSLVGEMRQEVNNLLTKIVDNCFLSDSLRNELFSFAEKEYGTKPDHPWEDDPELSVLRNQKGKWYALVMRIPAQKLIPNATGELDVMNIKLPKDTIPNRIDHKTIFPAWHMNKKYWVTVLLNGELPIEDVCRLLQESFETVKK